MKGLDVGTSFIILSQHGKDDTIEYKEIRDAFYVINPTTPIATKMIEKGLNGKLFVKDSDGSFVILGQDAIEKAVERNDSAKRPMFRGVVSSKEKDARRVLTFILQEVVGKAEKKGEKLVFCIPAQPIDQEDDEFDVGYHEDVVTKILSEQGYECKAINEAEALCYSELEKDDYTGVALSWGAGMVNCCVMLNGEPVLTFSTTRCLSKDYLISTNKGLLPIVSVKSGDVCFDNYGKQSRVVNVIKNNKTKTLTRIKVKNYSEYMDVTHNHKIWLKKSGEFNWNWVEASNVSLGDAMGVPIIVPSSVTISRNLYLYRQNNKNFFLAKSRDLGLFLGTFLGDGSAYVIKNNESDGRVSVSFNSNKETTPQNMKQYTNIVSKLFNKTPYLETRTKENCQILRFSSINLVKALRKICYNELGEKTLKISETQIPHQMALGIIEGLLLTDGYKTDGKYIFENTSSSVALMLQNLLARFNIRSSFTIRAPRRGGVNQNNCQINGTKKVYRIEIGHAEDNVLLDYLFTLQNNCNLPVTSNRFLERTVTQVETIQYDDYVYDLIMENESHCFGSPGGIVHNSGDWIDRMSAVATGETDSIVQSEKEQGDFTLGEPTDNQVLAAVSAYYERLIDYTAKNLTAHLRASKMLPKFKDPLPVVVAGGTSQAKGFVELFDKKLRENDFPVELKEVRHASDPLHAVARGCLIAAEIF